MPKTPARPTLAVTFGASTLAAGLIALMAQDAAFATLAEEQSAANAEPGPRQVPGHAVPVPGWPSPEARALIAAPYSPFWNATGATAEDWRAFEAQSAAATEPMLASLRASLGVTLEEATMGGVPCLVLTPESLSEAHAGQTVLNLHGGGYVYGSGASGTYEATLSRAPG